MSKTKSNVITYYWNYKNGHARIRDILVYKLWKKGIIKIHKDYLTIIDESNEGRGAFYSVDGPGILVDLLSWLTNIHMGKCTKTMVWTDNKTNDIVEYQENYKP